MNGILYLFNETKIKHKGKPKKGSNNYNIINVIEEGSNI